ncbi:serine/threonine protein kinase, partial [Streptomyces sp. TRM76130]|nr:serine/threonine protein kinase [Streptomyces sp. TRM76130]
MLAEAAEGRRPDVAQAYVPTGPVRYGPTETQQAAPAGATASTGPTASTAPAAPAASAGPI